MRSEQQANQSTISIRTRVGRCQAGADDQQTRELRSSLLLPFSFSCDREMENSRTERSSHRSQPRRVAKTAP